MIYFLSDVDKCILIDDGCVESLASVVGNTPADESILFSLLPTAMDDARLNQ